MTTIPTGAISSEGHASIENDNNRRIYAGELLQTAREKIGNYDETWKEDVRNAIEQNRDLFRGDNPIDELMKWINAPNAKNNAAELLEELWSTGEQFPADAVSRFEDSMPPEVYTKKTDNARRITVASFFMMGIDPRRFPPYQMTACRKTFEYLKRQGLKEVPNGKDYRSGLDLLQYMVAAFDELETPLDAQSLIWYWRPSRRRDRVLDFPRPTQSDLPDDHALNVILCGPPGTGKTWHTVTWSIAILENLKFETVEEMKRDEVRRRFKKYQNKKRVEMVTFHENTTYEDFVEGIRPILHHGKDSKSRTTRDSSDFNHVQYELSTGVFRRISDRANRRRNSLLRRTLDPSIRRKLERFVLIIDEINRGNISKIFGELITLVENSKRIGQEDEAQVTLHCSKEKFGVPNNLYILGTMNSADRSIALLDVALRRRFEFKEMMPDSSLEFLRKIYDEDTDGNGEHKYVDCSALLDAMNFHIRRERDRDHQIGHSYLMNINSLEVLKERFQNRIIPLLQEYFYDDWQKIDKVLNYNGFVDGEPNAPPYRFEKPEMMAAKSNQKMYRLLPESDRLWGKPSAYRKIYGAYEENETKAPSGESGTESID